MLYNSPQKLVDLCAPLSPIVFNNLFCLNHPQVHTLSIGAAKPTDFDEHLKTLELLDRADELLSPIIERLEQAAIDALGADWCETWKVGLPHWSETPDEVNIEMILWLRNLAIAYDMTEYGKMRYNLLGNGGHWFPGKRLQGEEVSQFAAVLRESPHRDRIPALLQETHNLLGGEAVQRLSQSAG
jgi:predicted aldo/keto reductase-like oxidoreductase